MYKGELALLLSWSLVLHQGLCGERIKVVQQPSNVLDDFTAYRHISIIHFNVPEHTVSALFKFTAKEQKLSGIGSCTPRNVSIYLKSGSIPFTQPDGSTIAAKLLKNRRPSFSYTLTSAGDELHEIVSTPAAGDWYAIAFRSWTDPDMEHISQQGIGVSCDTILDAELSIESAVFHSLVTDTNVHEMQLDRQHDSAIAQFIMEGNPELSNISLTSSCGNSCRVAVSVITTETLNTMTMNETEGNLSFMPFPKSFHYLIFRLWFGEKSNLTYALPDVKGESLDNSSVINHIPLLRKTLPDFFLFDFEQIDSNVTKPTTVNVSADALTVLSFKVGPVSDIGGTLSVGIKLVNNDRKDVVVFGCVSLDYYSTITPGGGCVRNDMTTAPDLFTQTADPSMVHAPYPEPGTWYLSLKAFSISPSPCECLETCEKSACTNCSCLQETSERVEISISSSPCIEGRCSSNGHCMHYMSGSLVFSACYCTGGYRGFDCADDTYVLTGGGILVRLLMLTLSNLAFIASIYVAIRREYYTEAIVYTAVMIFSTLYHACEAGEDTHNYCVTKLNVLQFCDFYNALLSIWVTLVAMASFGPRLTSFCQISGAIIIALGAELNRTALWVFMVPAVTGCLLICSAWGMRCRNKRSLLYPAKPYRSIYLPAGLLLVLLGLISYAFLQTRRNYHIVHSLWHVCVAVGVVLLLPSKKYMK